MATVEPEQPQSQAEKLLETLKPNVVARGSTGPGCGSGYEILLQVRCDLCSWGAGDGGGRAVTQGRAS